MFYYIVIYYMFTKVYQIILHYIIVYHIISLHFIFYYISYCITLYYIIYMVYVDGSIPTGKWSLEMNRDSFYLFWCFEKTQCHRVDHV